MVMFPECTPVAEFIQFKGCWKATAATSAVLL